MNTDKRCFDYCGDDFCDCEAHSRNLRAPAASPAIGKGWEGEPAAWRCRYLQVDGTPGEWVPTVHRTTVEARRKYGGWQIEPLYLTASPPTPRGEEPESANLIADAKRLMKRCQIGVGGRNALDDAHGLMADAYGTFGRLITALGGQP